ncbi:MAG: hypothetical protein V1840_02170 [Candidatus Omnitrophota bacterium]
MTLVELVLAIILLNIIILTGLSMELGMRRIFSSTDSEAQLLAEAVPIMTMVTKDINQAVGDVVNVAADYPYNYILSGGISRYQIRRDLNSNGLADSGDRFAEYRYNVSNYTLDYRPDSTTGSYTQLTNRAAQFSISAPVNGVSNISVTLRKNASLAANYTNPQVTLNSSAQYRGYSYN